MEIHTKKCKNSKCVEYNILYYGIGMGLDSTYYPPLKIRRSDLEDFLQLLGYNKEKSPRYLKQVKGSSFHYFSRKPYESLQGVAFTVMVENKKLIACGRNNLSRNKSDNDFHNYTLKQLRKRFGGYFVSDNGKNRYFPYNEIERKEDDSGCFIAIERALFRLKDIDIVGMALTDWKTPVQKGDMMWMNEFHPNVILANLGITHILSSVETFFKDIYVAILTYSDKKTNIIKKFEFRSIDLDKVCQGILRIEEAYANNLNFQNAESICKNFNSLDQNLCIQQTINKKHNTQEESFFEFIERISSQRHKYLHHGEKHYDYDMESLKKDSQFCKTMIKVLYKQITQKKNWVYDEDF